MNNTAPSTWESYLGDCSVLFFQLMNHLFKQGRDISTLFPSLRKVERFKQMTFSLFQQNFLQSGPRNCLSLQDSHFSNTYAPITAKRAYLNFGQSFIIMVTIPTYGKNPRARPTTSFFFLFPFASFFLGCNLLVAWHSKEVQLSPFMMEDFPVLFLPYLAVLYDIQLDRQTGRQANR